MTCGVYSIFSLIDSYEYIGGSKTIEERFRKHVESLRRGKHSNKNLLQAWNKFGEDNFVLMILEQCSPEELRSREQNYLPEERTPESLAEAKLYNIYPTAGNPRGYSRSEETRKKWSAASKGSHHSEDTKKKISAAQKGVPRKKWTEETRKKILSSRHETYLKKWGMK